MKPRLLVLATVFTLLVSSTGFLRAQTVPAIRAKISFSFTVKGTVLPPGDYEFVPGDNNNFVTIRPMGKGSSVEAMIITRIGGPIQAQTAEPHIVFDKIGERYFLSEVWLPGADGYLLHATNEKHTHQHVKATS